VRTLASRGRHAWLATHEAQGQVTIKLFGIPEEMAESIGIKQT